MYGYNMPGRDLRRRAHVGGGRAKPSPMRRSLKHSKPVKVLKRCSSEPSQWTDYSSCGGDEHDCKPMSLGREAGGHGGRSYTNVLASSPSLLVPSPQSSSEGYNREAKVVVNVTVEGSPGPLRAMVKLGSTVDETIKLVIHKYSEEGRTPKLDKFSVSSYELHHSYFSLQSLDKSELIGDVGSRSFYLRRNASSNGGGSEALNQEIEGVNASTLSTSSPSSVPPPAIFLRNLITLKMGKIVRKMRRLWRVIICMR